MSKSGNGNPLQYSCLENPMDGGAWWAAVHGVAGSRTRLSDFTFTFHCHALDKEMATHSSVLAWRIPGTGEPGGLPSLGSHGVGHDWSDLAAAAAAALLSLWACCMLGRFSCVWIFATPWTIACQSPLSMGLSKKVYWSGLPFHLPGDLPNPGFVLTSPMNPALAGGFIFHCVIWEALP